MWLLSNNGTAGIDTYVLSVSYTAFLCYAYPSYESLGPKINGASVPHKEKSCRMA